MKRGAWVGLTVLAMRLAACADHDDGSTEGATGGTSTVTGGTSGTDAAGAATDEGGCESTGKCPPTKRVCESNADCLRSEACDLGHCEPIVCAPGIRYCEGARILQCQGALGTASQEFDDCSKSSDGPYCKDRLAASQLGFGGANCVSAACPPSALVCDGDLATTCNAKEESPAPDGQDCSATGQRCYAGRCIDERHCTPGERVCADEDVYLCAGDGIGRRLFHDCEFGTACDDASAICKPVPQVCEAGERFCQDGNVYRCRTSGSGSVLAQECPAETPCRPSFVAGTDARPSYYGPGGADCLPPYDDAPCTPGEQRCLTPHIVAECDAAGTSSTLVQHCGNGWNDHVCSDGACHERRCIGQLDYCSGNVLIECALGDIVKKDCGDDAVCMPNAFPGQYQKAACVPRICSPGTLSCLYNDIWRCNADGIDRDFFEDCPPDLACDDLSADVHCGKPRCTAGRTACLANQIGPCAEDGSTLASVATDCAVEGQVCDARGGCADSVVDEMGAGDESVMVPSNFVANTVCVDSPRRLTRIELFLTLEPGAELQWSVESTSNEPVLGTTTSTTTYAGSGTRYRASGIFDVLLEAGSCYVLRVRLRENYSGVSFGETTADERVLSFGQAMGSFSQPYPHPRDARTLYRMRVLTELP